MVLAELSFAQQVLQTLIGAFAGAVFVVLVVRLSFALVAGRAARWAISG